MIKETLKRIVKPINTDAIRRPFVNLVKYTKGMKAIISLVLLPILGKDYYNYPQECGGQG